MGVPYFQVKDILSDIKATVFSSQFALYRDFSRRVFALAQIELGKIEQYSIDECFFTICGEAAVVEQKLFTLKRKLEQCTGIPVSIGVARSKTQAKYASIVAKKTNGVYVLSDSAWSEAVGALGLGQIWGIGRAREMQFQSKGLRTVAELIALSRAQVLAFFGFDGVRLWTELNGEVALPVLCSAPAQKSYMSTGSFPKSTSEKAVLIEAIQHHLQSVTRDLYQHAQRATRVRVLIYPSRHSDYAFQGASKEATLAIPTNDLFKLQEIALTLFMECYKSGVPYKRAGVVVSELVDFNHSTGSLFPESGRNQAMSDMLFTLQQRFGSTRITLGAVAHKSKHWRSQRDVQSPDYTTNWQSLKLVR